jgi:hypothetical protein
LTNFALEILSQNHFKLSGIFISWNIWIRTTEFFANIEYFFESEFPRRAIGYFVSLYRTTYSIKLTNWSAKILSQNHFKLWSIFISWFIWIRTAELFKKIIKSIFSNLNFRNEQLDISFLFIDQLGKINRRISLLRCFPKIISNHSNRAIRYFVLNNVGDLLEHIHKELIFLMLYTRNAKCCFLNFYSGVCEIASLRCNIFIIIERDVGDGTWWNIFTIT